jgi:hypothetical protein
VRRFIDWCLGPLLEPEKNGHLHWNSPLGSLEALASGTVAVQVQASGGPVTLDRATRKNIRTAFLAWLRHVTSHADNIGVFYFCGHGIMVDDHYLLAEDFGDPDEDDWQNAFNFTSTLRSLERQVKGALYFFIDACRVISADAALELGASPHPLTSKNRRKDVLCRSTTLLHATGEGKEAFAADGGAVSRFTEALVTALSGYCGHKEARLATWGVDGEALGKAVHRLVERSNIPEPGTPDPPQPQSTSWTINGHLVPLVQLQQRPKVKVELRLTPEQKRACYLFYLTSVTGEHYPDDGLHTIFQTEVPKGFYEVGARPTAPQFGSIKPWPDEELDPPLYRPEPMEAVG